LRNDEEKEWKTQRKRKQLRIVTNSLLERALIS